MDTPEQDPLLHPPGTATWEKQSKETAGWSRWTLAFAFSLFAVFIVAGLWSAVENARDAANRAWCTCKGGGQVTTAIVYYQEDHDGDYPPTYVLDENGRRVHSWRALILPYLAPELAKEYRLDEPWDGPNNSKLHHRMPKSFRCISDPDAPDGTTNYLAVVGDETIWPHVGNHKPSDVADGTSYTILVVETTGSNINWLEPRDLEFETMSFRINDPQGDAIRSHHKDGACFWMADGDREFFRDDLSPETLRGLLTISGGEDVSFAVDPWRR